MMKTTTQLISTLMLTVLLSLGSYSCKKGDIGPQGPTGEKGDKGDMGNANVKSKIYTANNITWGTITEFGTNYRTGIITIPALTTDIINNGAVMVYGGFFLAGSKWYALPLSFTANGIISFWSYGIDNGKIQLRFHTNANTTPSIPSISFRVILMTGVALASAKQNNINIASFNQVNNFFTIADDE